MLLGAWYPTSSMDWLEIRLWAHLRAPEMHMAPATCVLEPPHSPNFKTTVAEVVQSRVNGVFSSSMDRRLKDRNTP